MSEVFQPATPLASPHLQTLWGPLLRRPPPLKRQAERLALEDGDHLWLWHAGPPPQRGRPEVLLLHGLAGCEQSHYARGLQARLAEAGVASCIACARGAGDRPNDRARTWHAGETGDVRQVIEHLAARAPGNSLVVVGFSLGGSQLLNLLAEGETPGVAAAVAVSVPLQLAACSERLNRGLSRIYRAHLLRQLVASLETKKRYLEHAFPGEAQRLQALGPLADIRTFREFDDRVIAPLHGFRDADDYYARCSTAAKLGRIRTPTLLIHALDDPFMVPDVVPSPQQMSQAIQPEISSRGGHVGFVTGSAARPRYWLEQRIPAFLAPWLDARLCPDTGTDTD